MTAQTDSLQGVLASLSAPRMMQDVQQIASEIRLSGTPEEARSFDYIEAQIRDLGLEVTRLDCDVYVSLPGPASLEVLGPPDESVECITHSMSVSTPPGGLAGELRVLGRGSAADFAAADAAGCIALVDGLVSPGVIARAEKHGCAAVIFAGDDHLHQGIVSSLYGSPTTKTIGTLPGTPCVSIVAKDGQRLKELASGEGARVRVTTEVDTGWRDVPLVTVDVTAPSGDGTFAFFGSHVDSWDYGATDNAAGNAITLDLVRAAHANRESLRRGARFLFWSGHSHGRYAGSCWYVDHFWQDLYEHAIVGMSIDSPGTKGANDLGGAKVMDEASAVATAASELVVGHEVPPTTRPKGGEQPLWRVGITSMNPVRLRHNKDSGYSLSFSPSSPWWHHTTDDTFDKVDPDNLLTDAKIYAAAIWRFIASDVLPLDYAATARAVAAHVAGLDGCPQQAVLASAAAELEQAVAAMDGLAADEVNSRLRRIGRALVPALYTSGDLFEPDPTSSVSFIPGLARTAELAAIDPATSQAHALATELTRESNRVLFALRTATDVALGR
jgi:Zn-dependent M28 family amino/carboxypeptidase